VAHERSETGRPGQALQARAEESRSAPNALDVEASAPNAPDADGEYDERAAIAEFDAGLSRGDAERLVATWPTSSGSAEPGVSSKVDHACGQREAHERAALEADILASGVDPEMADPLARQQARERQAERDVAEVFGPWERTPSATSPTMVEVWDVYLA
jgi:hypothetical protein